MIRSIHYSFMNPTGNQTILVETDIPEENQPIVAAKLMQLEPSAEQVGFLSQSSDCDISLRMAGGEFCGNAAMSAAVYYGMNRGLNHGQITIRVSGTDQPVTVLISRKDDQLWEGDVEMPRPERIQTTSFSDGKTFPVVSFPGISHIILKDTSPCSEAETLAVSLCRELDAKALGLMFWDTDKKSLTPLVYVPAADTLFWESACASGTTAVGAWMAAESGHCVSEALKQPGGTLEILADPDGVLHLRGHVSYIYDKTVEIND